VKAPRPTTRVAWTAHFQKSCPLCDVLIVAGCQCANEGSSIACYEGTEETFGVGVCKGGQRTCAGGFWSQCSGQLLPKDEVCDTLDNDCDGQVDEGVLSPCADCNPDCNGIDTGPTTPLPFVPDEVNSEGVGLTEEGWIILDSTKLDLSLIWIANSGEGTVSKLDTKTGKELGRYITCSDPSRTAVDLLGDVWVACRGDGGVAKIRRHELTCEDKNGNGTIETSRDLDGDGQIGGAELLPAGQDECIQFIVYPGGTLKRAAGVDSQNYGWFGDWNDKTLRRLHPADGTVVQTISIPANPYGLVIDSNNIIWISDRGNPRLVRVDPLTGESATFTAPSGPTEPYGISLDYKGRVWMANCCSKHVAYRFDPVTQSWAETGTFNRPRGIAGSLDGRVFVANDEANSVAIINADTMEKLGQINIGPGRFPVGMAVDFDGYVWAVNQSASSATKIDPDTQTIIGEYPVGKSPYTYSDMTGYTLHNFTAPQGYYDQVIGVLDGFGMATNANEDGVLWTEVDILAEIPDGTHLEFEVRAANGLDELATLPFVGPFGPFPPKTFPASIVGESEEDEVRGKYLEIRVRLFSSDQLSTPKVKKISASFQ
jgi:DNA-binding beta-propeller fold protein YncE